MMWQNSLGHCALTVHFALGKKEVHVSLFQTVVLMLFNDADTLTYGSESALHRHRRWHVQRTFTHVSVTLSTVSTRAFQRCRGTCPTEVCMPCLHAIYIAVPDIRAHAVQRSKAHAALIFGSL